MIIGFSAIKCSNRVVLRLLLIFEISSIHFWKVSKENIDQVVEMSEQSILSLWYFCGLFMLPLIPFEQSCKKSSKVPKNYNENSKEKSYPFMIAIYPQNQNLVV